MKGALASSFARTLKDLHGAPPRSSVNPTSLKRLVGKWAPHLGGFAQQDSQEFTRFLLDGLHEDLKEREGPGPTEIKEKELESLPFQKQSDYWWARHLAKNDSFITSTFAGQTMSTRECCSCKSRSYCFEPFYDLSVAIPTERKGLSSR